MPFMIFTHYLNEIRGFHRLNRLHPHPGLHRCFSALAATLLLGCLSPSASIGQGLPAEARNQIHALFDHYESISRTVELTKTGYVAVTESEDPKVAAALKSHVAQMSKRLESGRMVRRWDPAFAEYVRHYDDMEHKIESTDKGLRVVVNGKTPVAVKVAQNHAGVIMDFAEHGWEAHDKRHAAVGDEVIEPAERGCCLADKGSKGCCLANQGAKGGCEGRCRGKGASKKSEE